MSMTLSEKIKQSFSNKRYSLKDITDKVTERVEAVYKRAPIDNPGFCVSITNEVPFMAWAPISNGLDVVRTLRVPKADIDFSPLEIDKWFRDNGFEWCYSRFGGWGFRLRF